MLPLFNSQAAASSFSKGKESCLGKAFRDIRSVGTRPDLVPHGRKPRVLCKSCLESGDLVLRTWDWSK